MSFNNYLRSCDSNLTIPCRTVRSPAKGDSIQKRYSELGDRFEVAVVEDLVTGDLTEAMKGALYSEQ